MGDVDGDGIGIADGAGGLRHRLHGEEHAAHVGMSDDGSHFARRERRACRPALLSLLRVSQRVLEGALGDGDALRADEKPRVVHHREHAGEPAIFLADQRADGAAIFAEGHDAGGARMYADLFFEADAFRVVARAEGAVFVDEEFRNEEERDALCAGRRVWQTGEDEVDDIVRHVVVAIGDEDFRAGDLVGAVALRHGFRLQRVQVGACLRLGQVHRAGPFTGDELRQINPLLLFRAMRGQRLDRALAQDRTEAEGHVGGVPHFLHGGGDRQRQALPAIFRRGGDRAPAALDPLAIGGGETLGGLHAVGFEADAFAVAGLVQGRENVARELRSLFQHHLEVARRQIGEGALSCQRAEARHFGEQKGHVADGGTVGHGGAFGKRV